jgi:hypothetical protein
MQKPVSVNCQSYLKISEEMGTITGPNAREYKTIIHLLLGSKTDINAILASEIEEKRI